jgi:hypothetical protein
MPFVESAASRANDAAAPRQTNQQHPCENSKEQGGIVDGTKPTPGSPTTKSARQQPGSSDIIERPTAKGIEAPGRPHTVRVMHGIEVRSPVG